jgi:phospholipase/lecithinase/hemolysin
MLNFRAALLSALLGAMPISWAQTPAPSIVTFGDSLSDSGNVFVVGNYGHYARVNNVPPAYVLDPGMVPSAAYARGGHHLSNGPTWIEVLAGSLGKGVNANPAFASDNPQAVNYAIAGARARNDGLNFNLDYEVQYFLQDFGGAPAEALYVIAVGSNDIRDALVAGDPSILQAALSSIAGNVQALYVVGARRFLVVSAPDIGLLPAVQAMGAVASYYATAFSAGFNQALQGAVVPLLEYNLPGAEILYFDLFGAVQDLHANASSYGMEEVNTPCITPETAPFVCANPDAYLFWDGVHPTKATHAILAGKVRDFLSQ